MNLTSVTSPLASILPLLIPLFACPPPCSLPPTFSIPLFSFSNELRYQESLYQGEVHTENPTSNQEAVCNVYLLGERKFTFYSEVSLGLLTIIQGKLPARE